MAAKREQVIWPHLWHLCSGLEETYSLTAILSAGLLAFSQMTGDEREPAIKAARRYRQPVPGGEEAEAIPLDVAIERVRTAATQYKLLSPEGQKWLDDLRAEAITARRLDTPADRIVADAHRKSAKRKAGRKETASRKPAKSPRSAG